MLAIAVLSVMPPGQEPAFSGFLNDKVKHFVCYGIVAHIACHASSEWRQRFLLCIITFAISVAIEFIQPYVGRDFELLDMAANLSGILGGIGVMILFLRWPRTKARS
ncbi:MAG: VanZ family protein [Sneathiella sp.]|nr:VanZ family protein [Sneathiella sp.]